MVNLPKSQVAKNINQSLLVFLFWGWLFGKLTLWRLTISPSIFDSSRYWHRKDRGKKFFIASFVNTCSKAFRGNKSISVDLKKVVGCQLLSVVATKKKRFERF
jgi:hypothetical protein